MRIVKTAEEIAFLRRVARAWAAGDYQADIAKSEGLAGGAAALHPKLGRMGFRFGRAGRLVTTLDGRDFADLDAAGEIVAAETDREPALAGGAK